MKESLVSQYLAELYRWNKKINLTSVAEEVAHGVLVTPSLAMLEYLPVGGEVFDIGSGGGIPGIVLAIYRPDSRFTLVESVGKKAVFLTHVARLLKLGNVRVAAVRAEKLACDPAYAGTADAVVSRAVKREDVVAAAKGLLKPGGRVIVHRSPKDAPDVPGYSLIGKNGFADCFVPEKA
ncbi:MAG: 16S rRNA (guanine(527)-N(7))-methyltransferase RsmG [Nitrospinae bacterium]|nr:16S rRNA (guanine(527)-N(7))-methyltransferase RsmG [Nitrospinota bacterium]